MNWLKPTHIAYWSIKYQTATDFSFLPCAHENNVRLFGPSNTKRKTQNQATNLSVENVVNSILLLSQHNLAEYMFCRHSFTHLHGMSCRWINMIFQVVWSENLDDLVICNIVAIDFKTLIKKQNTYEYNNNNHSNNEIEEVKKPVRHNKNVKCVKW